MKREKWFDKNFQFELSQDQYDSILNKLNECPARITSLISKLSVDVLTGRRENRWSIQENIGHLIDLEKLHDGRIDDFIDGKENLRPADLKNQRTEEANHNDKNINELLSQLKTVRENFVKRMQNLDQNVLTTSSIHPRLNQPMKPIDMAQFVLEHDEHHIQTIKELIDALQ